MDGMIRAIVNAGMSELSSKKTKKASMRSRFQAQRRSICVRRYLLLHWRNVTIQVSLCGFTFRATRGNKSRTRSPKRLCRALLIPSRYIDYFMHKINLISSEYASYVKNMRLFGYIFAYLKTRGSQICCHCYACHLVFFCSNKQRSLEKFLYWQWIGRMFCLLIVRNAVFVALHGNTLHFFKGSVKSIYWYFVDCGWLIFSWPAIARPRKEVWCIRHSEQFESTRMGGIKYLFLAIFRKTVL